MFSLIFNYNLYSLSYLWIRSSVLSISYLIFIFIKSIDHPAFFIYKQGTCWLCFGHYALTCLWCIADAKNGFVHKMELSLISVSHWERLGRCNRFDINLIFDSWILQIIFHVFLSSIFVTVIIPAISSLFIFLSFCIFSKHHYLKTQSRNNPNFEFVD